MKAVTAYQANDGKLFADKQACERHDVELSFDSWYQDNRLYGSSDSSVDPDDIKEWLLSHETEVRSFLDAAKE